MRGYSAHGGSLETLPGVGLPGKGCYRVYRVPQILSVSPPPRGETETSVFWHSGAGVASGNVPFTWHGILPATGRGLSVFALKGCSSVPLAFLFCCAGSSCSPELLRCQRNFLWSGGPVQFVSLPGLSLWFFRTCLGFRGTPSDIRVALSCFRMRSLSSSLPRLGGLGDSMLCLFLALGCGVLYFRQGFCDEPSGPSLTPRFAGFTVPAQPTRDNRNGRLLYPVRGGQRLPGPLWLRIVSDASDSLSAAQCNGKELSKTTVSFWLRMPLSRESCLSATERSVSCPLSSVLSYYCSVSSL